MFTGLIQEIGQLVWLKADGVEQLHLAIATKIAQEEIALGDSIACNGVCLTVTDIKIKDDLTWFFVTAAKETLMRSLIKNWQIGDPINLELSLKLGDRLGGHFVFGHVDGTTQLLALSKFEEAYLLRFSLPLEMAGLVAKKGSVALNGISLTVNAVGEEENTYFFEVMIVPYTYQHTTIHNLKIGDKVHFEADMLARYVARQHEMTIGR